MSQEDIFKAIAVDYRRSHKEGISTDIDTKRPIYSLSFPYRTEQAFFVLEFDNLVTTIDYWALPTGTFLSFPNGHKFSIDEQRQILVRTVKGSCEQITERREEDGFSFIGGTIQSGIYSKDVLVDQTGKVTVQIKRSLTEFERLHREKIEKFTEFENFLYDNFNQETDQPFWEALRRVDVNNIERYLEVTIVNGRPEYKFIFPYQGQIAIFHFYPRFQEKSAILHFNFDINGRFTNSLFTSSQSQNVPEYIAMDRTLVNALAHLKIEIPELVGIGQKLFNEGSRPVSWTTRATEEAPLMGMNEQKGTMLELSSKGIGKITLMGH